MRWPDVKEFLLVEVFVQVRPEVRSAPQPRSVGEEHIDEEVEGHNGAKKAFEELCGRELVWLGHCLLVVQQLYVRL